MWLLVNEYRYEVGDVARKDKHLFCSTSFSVPTVVNDTEMEPSFGQVLGRTEDTCGIPEKWLSLHLSLFSSS